jgi:hypothetical protein
MQAGWRNFLWEVWACEKVGGDKGSSPADITMTGENQIFFQPEQNSRFTLPFQQIATQKTATKRQRICHRNKKEVYGISITSCFYGGRARVRTADLTIKSRLLYQLSYAPVDEKENSFNSPIEAKSQQRLYQFYTIAPLGEMMIQFYQAAEAA